MRDETTTTGRQADTPAGWLPIAALLIGVWAIIPPYVNAFGKLDVSSRVEFADHVVPGITVLAVAVLGFLVLRSREPSQLLLFVGGGVITLAGFWMTATHLPLVSDAREDQAPWDAVLWHTVPGAVVTLFGLLWTIRYWGTEEADEVPSG